MDAMSRIEMLPFKVDTDVLLYMFQEYEKKGVVSIPQSIHLQLDINVNTLHPKYKYYKTMVEMII